MTATGARGAAGRVAAVQAQARVSLVLAGLFALAAAVVVVVPHETGRWLPMHLFLAGALLLAISGASQLFAVTWSAGPAPARGWATLQRTLLAGGVVLLVFGREFDLGDAAVGIGGSAIVAALFVLAGLLRFEVAGGVQRRFDPNLFFYLLALTAGVIACVIGIALASGVDGEAHARLRSVHMVLNVLGLVGLVIAGTLPFFSATEARVKMSPRAGARPQALLAIGLAGALALAGAGLLADASTVTGAGLLAYAAGVVGVLALVPRVGVKQLRWAGPRLVQLACGVAWWVGAVAVAGVRAIAGSDPFPPALLLTLVIGGYAQILAASLAYLGPVLRGGGHTALTAGFTLTRSWPGLAAANVAAVALALGFGVVAAVAVGAWVLDAAIRGVLLARPVRGAT